MSAAQECLWSAAADAARNICDALDCDYSEERLRVAMDMARALDVLFEALSREEARAAVQKAAKGNP